MAKSRDRSSSEETLPHGPSIHTTLFMSLASSRASGAGALTADDQGPQSWRDFITFFDGGRRFHGLAAVRVDLPGVGDLLVASGAR